MTKTELQTALAEATRTDKRTAGVFLDTLSGLASAIENQKPCDLSWQQDGSWQPLTAKSAKRLETIPVGAPVMPVGDGLGGLIADSDAFQLRQWQP